MKHLKNLLLALQQLIKAHPDINSEALKSVMGEALAFLTSAKSFEYVGNIKIPNGVAVKLTEVNMDFDDVVKAMAGKTFGIDEQCELYFILIPKLEEKDAA